MKNQSDILAEMKATLINDLNELKKWFTSDLSELHNQLCNTDYYIIGTYEAKQELEVYGVFEAIEKVRDYEVDNFGECNIDLSDPEKLINILYYIIGEEILQESETLMDNWDNQTTPELIQSIINELN